MTTTKPKGEKGRLWATEKSGVSPEQGPKRGTPATPLTLHLPKVFFFFGFRMSTSRLNVSGSKLSWESSCARSRWNLRLEIGTPKMLLGRRTKDGKRRPSALLSRNFIFAKKQVYLFVRVPALFGGFKGKPQQKPPLWGVPQKETFCWGHVKGMFYRRDLDSTSH